MKKTTLLSFVVLSIASIANAQITKGSVYLGGSIGGYNIKQTVDNSTTEGKRSSIFISPTIGIAVKNNLITGIDFTYSNSKSRNYNGYQDYKSNSYGGAFFLKKYFPLVKHFYLFGQGDLGYNQNKYESMDAPLNTYISKTSQKTISATLQSGLSLNVYKSFYIETAFPSLLVLGYNESTSVSNPNSGTGITTKDKGFSFESDLVNTIYLNIGVRFIIPKK